MGYFLKLVALVIVCAAILFIWIKIVMISRRFPQKETDYATFSKGLGTGDILLYRTYSVIPEMLMFIEQPCDYSHVSIILHGPTWLDKSLKDDYYILEVILDAEIENEIEHTTLKDIKLSPLRETFERYVKDDSGHLYTRKLTTPFPKYVLQERIKTAYNNIKDINYDVDVTDWFAAVRTMDENISRFNLVKRFHDKETMWCSALVAYVYKKCHLLDREIAWTIVNPCDFGVHTDRQHIKFINCKLGKEEMRL